MRLTWAVFVLLAPCGCGGFFEDNPEFFETETVTGTNSDTGLDVSGAEPVCEPDPYELNDEEDLRTQLDPPQGGNVEEVTAMLEGAGAVDWYTYDGQEQGNGPRYPKVMIVDAPDLRVCVYLKCLDGSSVVIDCGAEEPEQSPFGYSGCCGISESTPQHQCSGMPGGDVQVEARISDAANTGQCVPYTFEYRF